MSPGVVAAGLVVVAGSQGVPTGVGYTLLLLAHVACAVVGFGAICLTGIQSARAHQGPAAPNAEALRRYFRPGPNWAARTLYGVPIFGFALLAASGGAFDASDTFVVVGLGLWLAAAIVAEVVVWPGERRIQLALHPNADEGGDAMPAEVTDQGASDLTKQCRRVSRASALLALIFVAAVVLMVGKP